MTTYSCSDCGMEVDSIRCAKCGAELEYKVLTLDDGSNVNVSMCPNGHGKIKSPTCCGSDMSSSTEMTHAS